MYSIQSQMRVSPSEKRQRKQLRKASMVLFFLGGTVLNLYSGFHIGRGMNADDDETMRNLDEIDGIVGLGNSAVHIISPSQTNQSPMAPAKPAEIAWLMSFPNSGTTYVIKFIQKGAGRRAGTNYLREANKIGKVPIYEDQPQGPFWMSHTQNKPSPGEYVLTKTHCGGYVIPKERNMDRTANGRFVWECAMAKINDDISTAYPMKHVKKAVHLIRDPFANIVARFNNHFKDQKKDVQDKFQIDEYNRDKKGFREFCANLDKDFEQTKREFLNEHQISLMEDVPCSGEFILYVIWHNNAFKTTKMLDLDVMILHYDSFETKYEQTSDDLLDFLGYSNGVNKLEFVAGKTYDDHFTPKQRVKAKEVLKELASEQTWNEIKGYFEEKAIVKSE